MTQEHGGTLLPLLRQYWGGKLARAVGMLHRREFSRVATKVRSYFASIGRHRDTGRRTDY